MQTTPVTPDDLSRSVMAVPPLARHPDLRLNAAANERLIKHLQDGGVSTVLYGGNANLYNIGGADFHQLIESLPRWVADDTLVIPSIGPSYGTALDQIDLVRGAGYPTAMLLPLAAPATPEGTATGVRKIADRFGRPLVLYLKDESYLSAELIAELVSDDVVSAIKYAVVRTDPTRDPYLEALLDRVDRAIIVSGIGERPAIAHLQGHGLQSFTSGSVCVAPRRSSALLAALKAGERQRADTAREGFLPLEDLRDGIHPIRVLHEAVTLAGVADMGPTLPMLSGLGAHDREKVRDVAEQLYSSDAAYA